MVSSYIICNMMSQDQKANEYWIFDQKCKKILQEPEIRFAGVINKLGRLVAGGFKEGLKPLEDDAERQKMYMELALRVSMRKDFDYSLGAVKYSASRREKAVVMSFPMDSNILLISAEPDSHIEETASKIMKLVGLI